MFRTAVPAVAAALMSASLAAVVAPAPAHATAPGVNGKIVFTSDRSGANQIWVANPGGSALTQLTSNTGASAFPAWSPDGTKIAFDGGPDPAGIYVMNADGSGVHRVTDPGLFVSWSGDGAKLAYIRQANNAAPDIFTINVDGTGETNITNDPINDIFPSWSPDGSKIVFIKNGDPSAGVWTMNADGTNQTRLTNNGLVEQAPSFSPDGASIVFDRSVNGNFDLYRMDADGSNVTQLTTDAAADLWPRWSPDSTQIVFQTGATNNGPFDLQVMNADGSGVHALATNAADDEFPDWQPTAPPPTRLIVTGPGPGGGPDVRIFTATGQFRRNFFAYGATFPGGVRVAAGDLAGSGQDFIVTGPGAGGGPHVRTFTQTGTPAPASFFAYGSTFAGGVYVAAGDVDGDGKAEIITGPGPGGGPNVRVWKVNVTTGAATLFSNFMAYDAGFTGGVKVGAADLGNGVTEVITGAGPGGGPNVRAFRINPTTGAATLDRNFMAYGPAFGGGVFVAGSSALHGIVTGAGPGGGPNVRLFTQGAAPVANFFPYDPRFTGGVHVATSDLNADGAQEIVTGAGEGGGPQVRVFSAGGAAAGAGFFAYGTTFPGGVFVAVAAG